MTESDKKPPSPTEAESMHGWRFDKPFDEVERDIRRFAIGSLEEIKAKGEICTIEYIIERCRRAEAKIVELRDDADNHVCSLDNNGR